MDIFLIRHGECYDSSIEHYNTAKKTMDPPLTDKGIWQAEKLASRCKNFGFDRVYRASYRDLYKRPKK